MSCHFVVFRPSWATSGRYHVKWTLLKLKENPLNFADRLEREHVGHVSETRGLMVHVERPDIAFPGLWYFGRVLLAARRANYHCEEHRR